jgi:hypothetical protein
MVDQEKRERSEADAELERQVRDGRKFTLEEAVGRMVGPGGMKGQSPITRLQQAETEIGSWIRTHLPDSGCALKIVLHRQIKGSEILLNGFDQPLTALAGYCQQILGSDYRLQELVRDADVEWGRVMGERPFLEKEGSPPHPDDPYTIESVRKALSGLVEQLASSQ